MTDCCTTRSARSTRWATRTPRTRSQVKHNRAKVGSSRPSSLLYTYGPGRDHGPAPVHDHADRPGRLEPDLEPAPRGRPAADPRAPAARGGPHAHALAPNVQLRPFPWQPKRNTFSNEGADLGVPARVFPQWLRCTGCDMLGLVSQFSYVNTHPYRTDLARFEHPKCPGRGGAGQGDPPGCPGPVPARLRGGAPGRVPVRAVGAPGPPLREGRVPDPEDDRPDRGQGRVGDDPLRVLRLSSAR